MLGEEHPDTLATMENVAALNRDQGKYPEAAELITRVLQHRTLGEEHPLTLYSMDLLAIEYREEGKYAKAEELTSKSLAIRSRVLGPEHRETLQSMNDLAGLYGVIVSMRQRKNS